MTGAEDNRATGEVQQAFLVRSALQVVSESVEQRVGMSGLAQPRYECQVSNMFDMVVCNNSLKTKVP